MTSEELAQVVGDLITTSQTRVMGVGNEQYSTGDMQRFETLQLDELVDWTKEELSDLVVYSTMLWIRLTRIQEAINDLNVRVSQG